MKNHMIQMKYGDYEIASIEVREKSMSWKANMMRRKCYHRQQFSYF